MSINNPPILLNPRRFQLRTVEPDSAFKQAPANPILRQALRTDSPHVQQFFPIETPYDKYKDIKDSNLLSDYKTHLVSLVEEAIEESQLDNVFVSIFQEDRKLIVEVKQNNPKKEIPETIAEFVVEVGREDHNDLGDYDNKKPRTLTKITHQFNGKEESSSRLVSYMQAYRIDLEFAYFLDKLKNEISTPKIEKPWEKLKLTRDELLQVMESS